MLRREPARINPTDISVSATIDDIEASIAGIHEDDKRLLSQIHFHHRVTDESAAQAAVLGTGRPHEGSIVSRSRLMPSLIITRAEASLPT